MNSELSMCIDALPPLLAGEGWGGVHELAAA
jgi:hypothetical protein